MTNVNQLCNAMEVQDAGVHALSNVCHVDIQRISKRRPGEVVRYLLNLIIYAHAVMLILSCNCINAVNSS